MSRDKPQLPSEANRAEVEAFLQQVAGTPARAKPGRRGRLIFAMDATASRQGTWDKACRIQGDMFVETSSLGGLETQLCWYRGYGEFHAEDWSADGKSLLRYMSRVFCLGGATQIEKVLKHAVAETGRRKIDALVLVGDCMEEDADRLCHLAGQLGLLGVPVFVFQEGNDAAAQRVFEQIARLSGGAHCRFDVDSARQLRDLLSAVAVYAAGGRHALEDFGQRRGGDALRLTRQIGGR